MKINIFINGAQLVSRSLPEISLRVRSRGSFRPAQSCRPDKSRFYFNDRPQPATERSAVSSLYGAAPSLNWDYVNLRSQSSSRGGSFAAGWRRKRSLVLVAARSNWELNCDNKARKAIFFILNRAGSLIGRETKRT